MEAPSTESVQVECRKTAVQALKAGALVVIGRQDVVVVWGVGVWRGGLSLCLRSQLSKLNLNTHTSTLTANSPFPRVSAS